MDTLIEDLTTAAEETIEKAAAEAAKAAALASLEREAAALREAARMREEAQAAKKAGRKNVVIAAVVGFLGGLAIGAGSVLIIRGR